MIKIPYQIAGNFFPSSVRLEKHHRMLPNAAPQIWNTTKCNENAVRAASEASNAWSESSKQSFCVLSTLRVFRTDRQTDGTDGQTDRQTDRKKTKCWCFINVCFVFFMFLASFLLFSPGFVGFPLCLTSISCSSELPNANKCYHPNTKHTIGGVYTQKNTSGIVLVKT